jgi:hypothetical protein
MQPSHEGQNFLHLIVASYDLKCGPAVIVLKMHANEPKYY